MNRNVAIAISAAGFSALAGCVTTPAVSYGVKIDPDARPSCESNCAQMGLKLSAVVLVRDSVGCVCAVQEAKVATATGSDAIGIAAGVLIVEDETRQAQTANVPAVPPRQSP